MIDCIKCVHFKVCQSFGILTGRLTSCPNHQAEVVHGRWEPRTDVVGFVRCSVCRDCNIYDDWADGKKWNYCPNCGADMR